MTDLFPIIYANEDGQFLLYDKSYGNPGCDICGEFDATVKAGGTYFCQHCFGELKDIDN